MADKTTRRITTREDLDVCLLCEDYWCLFHGEHFYDCPCVLEEWQYLDD